MAKPLTENQRAIRKTIVEVLARYFKDSPYPEAEDNDEVVLQIKRVSKFLGVTK